MKGHIRNIPVKLFQNISNSSGEKLFKGVSIFLLWQSSCSAEQSRLCNFGKRSPKNMPVKLLKICLPVQQEKAFKFFFFQFLALTAILFSRAEWFETFSYRVTHRTFLRKKKCPSAWEEKLFKCFLYISSGGHLVHLSLTD